MVSRVDTPKLSPADLPERIARGDLAAESELVERFRPGLVAMLSHRLRHRHLAEDACQETLRIAIENLRAGSLREPARLAGYVCGIAANLARKEYRRARRAAAHAVEAAGGSRDCPAESDMLIKERSRAIRQVLNELSTRDREVLTEFYLREGDKSEICRRFRLSADQFDVIKFRALRRFERLWSRRNEP